MTPRRSIFLRAAWAFPWLAAIWLGASSGAAATLRAPAGESGWWALETGSETCVMDSGGERRVCFPRPGRLTDLRETPGGWVAAGYGAIGGDPDIFVIRYDGVEVERLEPPTDRSAARGSPRLVGDEGRWEGLVWLEGAAQATLEVRAAEWLDGAWAPAVTVSPVGPGSQVAPAATVLEDGRWLVVWTAFDGEDDETVWSVFDGRRWTTPASMHEDNATPDILPALLATPGGAIAAWSWLDGRDYRLRTAFFDGAAWRLDPPLEGRGALDVGLLMAGGAYLLSHSTVVPYEWVVYELDGEGRVLRRAAVTEPPRGTPLVDFAGAGVILRWPDQTPPQERLAPWELGYARPAAGHESQGLERRP